MSFTGVKKSAQTVGAIGLQSFLVHDRILVLNFFRVLLREEIAGRILDAIAIVESHGDIGFNAGFLLERLVILDDTLLHVCRNDAFAVLYYIMLSFNAPVDQDLSLFGRQVVKELLQPISFPVSQNKALMHIAESDPMY
jgi:hypothetical protein